MKSKSMRDKLSNAGVLSAILTSRRFGIHRDLDSLRYLLRRWHRDTHTFFCSWGEITPTLDDVAALYDLPIVGTHSPMDPPASADCDALIAELTKSIHACQQPENRLSTSRGHRPTCALWIRLFWGGPDRNKKFKPGSQRRSHSSPAAMVLLWLSRFVFPSPPEDTILSSLIPLAVYISQGVAFPLAPLFLGRLYSLLDYLVDEEDSGGGHFVIESYIPISFLQVFMWERFREYSPEPLSPDASRKFILDSPDLFSTLRRTPFPRCSRWLRAHTLKH